MKKSAQITLTVVAAMGLAACNRDRRDPCASTTFDDWACQEAVRNGGYYHRGTWFPMVYSHPYPYYYDSYSRHIASGGRVQTAEPGAYAKPAGAPSRGPAHSVSRGGFGSIGSGRGVSS